MVLYVVEKYRHEMQRDGYIADMLWAPANGMVFKNVGRYRDIIAPAKPPEATGKEILDEILNAW